MSKVVEEILLKVRVDNKQSNKAMKKLGDQTKNTTKKVDQLGKAFKVIGSLLIANQLKNLALTAIEVSDSFTRVTNSLETTFGSMQAANEQMMFLDETAERLGTDLLATAKGFAQIAASGKKAGLSTKEVQEIFTGASEASAALSLSADDTNGVLLAMSQIMSKGKVQAEELRGQIGERLPGAFNIAAESMGLTTQELDKLMQSGDLAANEFMPAFAKALQNTFHEGAMKNATKSIANATRVQNEWNKSLKEVGEPIKVISTSIGSFLLDALGSAADIAVEFTDSIQTAVGVDIQKGISEGASALGEFGVQAKKATMEIERLTEAEIALNKISLNLEQAEQLDSLRREMGLTSKGFNILKREFGGGEKLLDLSLDKTAFGEFSELVDKILEAQKGGGKQFKLINQEDMAFAKMLDKFGAGEFDPFLGLGQALFDSLGKVGDFKKLDEEQSLINRGPTEALEGRSAEALRFAARPVEKNLERLAEEQLGVQQGIERGINNLAMNDINTGSL